MKTQKKTRWPKKKSKLWLSLIILLIWEKESKQTYWNIHFDIFSVTPFLRMLGQHVNEEGPRSCPCLGTITKWIFTCLTFRVSKWVRKYRVFVNSSFWCNSNIRDFVWLFSHCFFTLSLSENCLRDKCLIITNKSIYWLREEINAANRYGWEWPETGTWSVLSPEDQPF